MSLGSKQMQKTIPRSPREQIQTQTDLNLLGRQMSSQELLSSRIPLRLADFYSENGILRPFSDYHLFSQLEDLVARMKKDVEQQIDGGKQQKLLQYLSTQINGLLKRQLYVEGKNDSYYSLLGEKDREILNMEIKYSSFDSKIKQAQQKISEFQAQIIRLRSSLNQFQNVAEENSIYRECFVEMSLMLKQSRKLTDIQSYLNEKINPLIKETQSRLQLVAKNASRDRRNKAKGVLAEYAKQLNSFYQDPNLNLQILSQSVAAFYTNLEHINEDNWINQRIRISSDYEKLKNHQTSLISLLNKNVEQILSQNPSLKSLREFQEFARIIENESRNGVETLIVNGWISVGKGDSRVIQVPVQDVRTKEVISLLSSQVKKLAAKYPQIKSEMSATLTEFLTLDVLDGSIQVDALDRLKEILVYKSDLVTVENVYNYSNQKDKDLIFHLRILIKSLLEELQAIRIKHGIVISLDEGIIGMLNQQIIDGVDISAILALYRPQPKIVQVERIVDRPVYVMDELQHGVPIRVEKGIYGERTIQQPIFVQKSVPVQIQKPFADPVKEFVQLKTMCEVPIEVPTIVEKAVDRIMIDEKVIEVSCDKIVPCREEVKEIITSEIERIVKEPQIIEKQTPIQLERQIIKEIEKYIDKPVYLFKESQRAVEVPVIKQLLMQKPIYIEVQKKIPYVVRTPEIHQLIKQVPKIIKETTQVIKPVPEIIEKIVQVNVEKDPELIEVPVTVEKELVKEIQKEIYVEMTHFVKPDRQEIIKEVETFIDKPIIQEIIVSKDVEVEKVTPLYIREEKPIYIEHKVPLIKPEYKPVDLVVQKPIFLKEEVIKEVKVEVPVPIIIEKQVIKVQEVIREKIQQKIVEVPRVQVVEKIVQKIVPVPRIIEKIVEVPQIIEKCVVIERPILQIAQIPVEKTVERKVEVPKLVQITKEVLVENPVFTQIEVELPVERVLEKEVPVEIQLEKRIPQEVIKEIPVEVYRDRIVEKIVQINEVQVKDREVQIPVIVEQPVPIIQEKPVIHQKTVENIQRVTQTVEKIVPSEKIIERQVQIHLKEEVPIDQPKLVQVPGETTIKYEKQYADIEVIQQKIVQVQVREEVPRQVFLEVEKIVPLSVEKIISNPQVQYFPKPEIIQTSHPVHHINYKQVPIIHENIRHVPVRTILEQIRQIEVQVEKAISVTVEKEKIVKCIENIKEWCTKEVPKDIVQEVPLKQTKQAQIRQIQVEKLIQPLRNKIVEIQESQKTMEKVVEKIVMLPQIVEVVKTIHEISQVQSLGVAKDVELQIHTKEYVGLTKDLKAQISSLLASFKSKVRSQPDLKILIENMQKYLIILDKWIRFPKIIQIPKEVEKIIEKDRPVLVPTKDIEKEVALMSIIEQLILGIRKFRRDQIRNNFDENILKIFFMDLDLQLTETSLENKYLHYIDELRGKYQSFGNWADSHMMILNSFLQSKFAMTNIIDEANKANIQNRDRIVELEKKLDEATVTSMINELAKEKTANDYASLVKSLMGLSTTYEVLETVLSNHTSILQPQQYYNDARQTVTRSYQSNQVLYSRNQSERPTESILEEKEREISSIIVKLSTAEHQKLQIEKMRIQLQRQNENLRYELETIRDRAEGDANREISSIQQLQGRINQDWERRVKSIQENYEREQERLRSQLKNQLAEGTSSNELTLENRKLLDEIRSQKREYQNFKRTQESMIQNLESQKKRSIDEYERKIKNLMETHERQKKRQLQSMKRSADSSQQSSQLAKQRLIDEYERKIKNLTEAHQRELAKSSSSVKGSPQQLLQVKKLREQIRRLEIELQTSKREIQEYQKSRLGKTTFTSNIKQSVISQYQRVGDPYKSQGIIYRGQESEEESLQGSRISKQSHESKKEEIRSASSKISGKSVGGYQSSMSMKDLLDVNSDDKSSIATLVMIKIIQKVEEQASKGRINCYTPAHIYFSNFNPSNLEALIVTFTGAITNKKSKFDGLYLPPEVHRGDSINMKSVVFNLAVIWDQLIHSQLYYKNVNDVESSTVQFKVRDAKLNPILKNTLFEMMSKDIEKRLELNEAKRRLSLQKYISAEGGRVVVTSSRISEQMRR